MWCFVIAKKVIYNIFEIVAYIQLILICMVDKAYEFGVHQKYQPFVWKADFHWQSWKLTAYVICIWSSSRPCLRLSQIASSTLIWCADREDNVSLGTKGSFITLAVPSWNLERSGQYVYSSACFLLCYAICTRNMGT